MHTYITLAIIFGSIKLQISKGEEKKFVATLSLKQDNIILFDQQI